MKEIEISGANRFETFTKTRAGSRAVILRDGMILLSHETETGWCLAAEWKMAKHLKCAA